MLTTEIVSYKNAFQCKRNKNERVTVKAPVTHMLGDLIFDLMVHFSKLASLRIILLHRSCENRKSYRNCIQEIICHFWRVLTVYFVILSARTARKWQLRSSFHRAEERKRSRPLSLVTNIPSLYPLGSSLFIELFHHSSPRCVEFVPWVTLKDVKFRVWKLHYRSIFLNLCFTNIRAINI